MKGRFLIQVFILASFSILSGKCYSCYQDPTAVISGSDPRNVCVGETENFNGSYPNYSHDNDEGGSSIVGYQWSCPGANVDSPTASSTDITFGNSGSYTVTLTVTDDETATDNETCQVTVVEVASLLPDVGTEFDDGDGNPDTKSYYVCGATSGYVTVTATPNPSVAEADLPACWTLEGGTGTSKLVRTVSKTDGGVHTITCTAGTSSKITKIYIYGHPINFCSINCGGPPSSNHYGASIYYAWGSTTGDNCDLAECYISESFCDYQEDRPPFYAGSAPSPWDPLTMDILFNGESLGDDHGIRKDLVHDYEEGVRSYGQFLKWECAICGASGTLSTVAVGFIVYDNASSPPPNDWHIETRIIPDCPGCECETDKDIPE